MMIHRSVRMGPFTASCLLLVGVLLERRVVISDAFCFSTNPLESSASTTTTTTTTTTFSFSLSSSTSSSSSYSTLGQDISTLVDWTEGWEMARRFWIPTDDPQDVPPHFQSQLIHHERRQRWASHFLLRLSSLSLSLSPSPSSSHTTCTETRSIIHPVVVSDDTKDTRAPTVILDRPALTRVVQAAALPFPRPHHYDRVDKEGVWIVDSLTGIYALVGRFPHDFQPPSRTTFPVENGSEDKEQQLQQHDPLLEAIQLLMDRASALNYPHLDQACRALWTIQGLVARMEGLVRMPSTIVFQERVQALPFSILPCGVDWSKLLLQLHEEEDEDDDDRHDPPVPTSSSSAICQTFLQVIPFQKDVIVTRLGDQVQERRGTAWIAQEGIGALAYSGKLMPPHPVPTIVQKVMRNVEERLELPPSFFDCALCNHYADATAACKFHTDPEHGTMWDRTTVVVAAGSDRIFAFKPIDTTWMDWDIISVSVGGNTPPLSGRSGGEKTAATVHLFSGDLVVMKENCNDDFYHAVYSGRNDDPRVSLVLKRAMGRGHGLEGQGKRRRSKRTMTTTTTTTPPPTRSTPRSPPAGSTTMRKTPSSGRGGRNNATGGSKR